MPFDWPPPQSRTLTGAWIETNCYPCRSQETQVAPSRVRGLKHFKGALWSGGSCRTLTGAWIETLQSHS